MYQAKPVKANVFRAYDIRGIIDSELDENAFYSIGKAISCRLRALDRGNIFLARDGRLTSEKLAYALKQGFLDSGIDVLDLGATTTPVMYFATHTHYVDSGVMVTGSHNPADYNGIKIVLAGTTLENDDIQLLYNLVQRGESVAGQGIEQTYPIFEEYAQCILSDISLQRPFKVVVDCGNGIAGLTIPSVLTQLGCEVVPLYCDVDGRFPNHHPDPTVEENLGDLRSRVLVEKADIGLAFDGDADRLGVITNTGDIIWPDRLLMFYIKELLSRKPGATIVYDVKCSSHLGKVIVAQGGVAKMCPTGHSIVKRVMREEQAALAGEMSGHVFFKDRWYGFDDALYSACRLLEILSQSLETVHEQFAYIPNSINTPEIKISITEDKKFAFMSAFLEKASFPSANFIKIDGLRAEFEDGWGLIRASNTTPCLVARFEAKDEQSLATIQASFKAQLHAVDPNLVIPF